MDIELTREDLEHLMRPIAGRGGWQSLLRKLQKQVQENRLTLTESDSQRILRYILFYGSGGWQDRLAGIAGKAAGRSTARKAARKR